MSFHFQPVSFSLEASPCRSPCPLATDVLSEKEEWSCFVDQLSVVQYLFFPSFFPPAFFFFFFFYLELGCQEKEKKRSEKSTERLNQIQ